MLELELAELDPYIYAETIRETLDIVEYTEIDYEGVANHPPRLSGVKYFIPDVYAPGRYNWRADLIERYTYYLRKF